MDIDPHAVQITDRQATLLEAWLDMHASASRWFGDYALGCTPDASEFEGKPRSGPARNVIQQDRAVAKEVPQLRGYRADQIQEYLVARMAMGGGTLFEVSGRIRRLVPKTEKE